MNELIQLWQLQSAIAVEAEVTNSLVLIYAVLSLVIRKPSLLAAYLLSELIFLLGVFDPVLEWHLYAIECIIYSYVFTLLSSNKSKAACLLLIFISMFFIDDARKFGIGGIYGESETVFYQYITSIYVFAHLLLVTSFVSIRRIRDNLRDIIDSITRLSNNGYYLLII